MFGCSEKAGSRSMFALAGLSLLCASITACGDDGPTPFTESPADRVNDSSYDVTAEEFEAQRLAWNGGADANSCSDNVRFEVELVEEYSDLIGEFEVTQVVPADVLFRLEYGDSPLVEECDGTVALGMDVTLRPTRARVRPTALDAMNADDGEIVVRLTAAELDSSWYSMVTYDENGEIFWYNDSDGEGRIYEGDRVFLTAIYSEEEDVFSTTGHPIIFEYQGSPVAVDGDEFTSLGCFELEWPISTNVSELAQRERDLFSSRSMGSSDPDAALGTLDTPRSSRGADLYAKRESDMTRGYFRRAAQCFPDVDEDEDNEDPDAQFRE